MSLLPFSTSQRLTLALTLVLALVLGLSACGDDRNKRRKGSGGATDSHFVMLTNPASDVRGVYVEGGTRGFVAHEDGSRLRFVFRLDDGSRATYAYDENREVLSFAHGGWLMERRDSNNDGVYEFRFYGGGQQYEFTEADITGGPTEDSTVRELRSALGIDDIEEDQDLEDRLDETLFEFMQVRHHPVVNWLSERGEEISEAFLSALDQATRIAENWSKRFESNGTHRELLSNAIVEVDGDSEEATNRGFFDEIFAEARDRIAGKPTEEERLAGPLAERDEDGNLQEVDWEFLPEEPVAPGGPNGPGGPSGPGGSGWVVAYREYVDAMDAHIEPICACGWDRYEWVNAEGGYSSEAECVQTERSQLMNVHGTEGASPYDACVIEAFDCKPNEARGFFSCMRDAQLNLNDCMDSCPEDFGTNMCLDFFEDAVERCDELASSLEPQFMLCDEVGPGSACL